MWRRRLMRPFDTNSSTGSWGVYSEEVPDAPAEAPGAAPAPDASWVIASQALDYFYFVIDMFILLLLWFWDSFL